MATAVTSNKIFSNCSLKLYDHDPGATSAVVVSGDGGTTKNYLAMRDYRNFAVVVMNSVVGSASGPTLVEILAATDSTGSGAVAVVTSGTVASVTVGDNILIECTDEQIKEVLAAATHVTARITCSNSGDECVVLMARFGPRFPQSGLSANNIT